MGLPWLESLHALADVPPPSAFPKRFGIVFLGNGINEDHWSAEGQGAAMKLSKTLSPLEPLKEKINVIDGRPAPGTVQVLRESLASESSVQLTGPVSGIVSLNLQIR